MRSLLLAAGVAALAITAPAASQPGNGKGGGKGNAAKVERGGGGQKADRGGGQQRMAKQDRGPQGRSMKADRPDRQRAERRNDRQRIERRAEQHQDRKRIEQRAERRNDRQRAERQAERRAERQRAERRVDIREDRQRMERRQDRVDRRDRGPQRLADRYDRRDRRDDDIRLGSRFWDGDDRWDDRFVRGTPAGFVEGCPPGLAKKSPACIPPGQAKQWIGQKVGSFQNLYGVPNGLRDIYRDTDDYYYRYGDGYLYRVDRGSDLVNALMPLFGLGLSVGQPFPYGSSGYGVPSYYQPFYQGYGDDYYRYANGYMYEIDGRNGLIEDIIPLYDRGYGVGQMLPASYSYYNVPYPYRDYYADNDDYYYRYAPGAIYQVDQETQLITAVASLLTGNNALSVGQPLPMGYSAYNVPYSYRDRYYDTPDNWYRYSNGYIYQVDPQTRLITALIEAIV